MHATPHPFTLSQLSFSVALSSLFLCLFSFYFICLSFFSIPLFFIFLLISRPLFLCFLFLFLVSISVLLFSLFLFLWLSISRPLLSLCSSVSPLSHSLSLSLFLLYFSISFLSTLSVFHSSLFLFLRISLPNISPSLSSLSIFLIPLCFYIFLCRSMLSIHTAPQTDATTFAFASLSILLLCCILYSTYSTLSMATEQCSQLLKFKYSNHGLCTKSTYSTLS